MKTPVHLRPLARTLLKIAACALAMLTAVYAQPANDQPEPSLMAQAKALQAEARPLLAEQRYAVALPAYMKAAETFMQAAAELDESDKAALEQKKEALREAGLCYLIARDSTKALEASQQWLALEDKSADPLAWAEAADAVVYVHGHLGNYSLAEPLARESLRLREQELGAEHTNVSIALNKLAALLHTTNRLAEAEPLMRRALAIVEANNGPEHPDVATGLNNLASLLQARTVWRKLRRFIAVHWRLTRPPMGPATREWRSG